MLVVMGERAPSDASQQVNELRQNAWLVEQKGRGGSTPPMSVVVAVRAHRRPRAVVFAVGYCKAHRIC